MDYKGRQRRLQEALHRNRLDALMVTHLPNIRYLCGFTGSSGVLLVTARDSVLLTDGRYTEQAKREVKGAKVKIVKKSALAAAAEWFQKHSRLTRIAIEATHMTVADRASLAKGIGKRATIVAAQPIVEPLRMIKDAGEIAAIRAACHLGAQLFRTLTKYL